MKYSSKKFGLTKVEQKHKVGRSLRGDAPRNQKTKVESKKWQTNSGDGNSVNLVRPKWSSSSPEKQNTSKKTKPYKAGQIGYGGRKAMTPYTPTKRSKVDDREIYETRVEGRKTEKSKDMEQKFHRVSRTHDRENDQSKTKHQKIKGSSSISRKLGNNNRTQGVKNQESEKHNKPERERHDSGAHAHERFPAKHLFEGTIRINMKGTGFVKTEELKDDIEIDASMLNTALDGDRVKILLHSKIVGIRQGGEVVEILLRNKMRFVGKLEREGGAYFCAADDNRMYRQILIPKQYTMDAEKGDKVYVEITKWTDPKQDPIGKVIKVIGKIGEHETEMQSIVLERGFDTTFPPDVLAAAEKIPTVISKEEIAKRRDFRNTLTYTIDPKDAKDFDDALSWKKLPNGNIEVGVHIADVSHYVTPGSTLDKEGAERGTSIYLVDRTIPMLPERLSNGICSLVPNEDRLCFAAVFELDKNAQIVHEWFGRTIIHSQKRFTYESAQEVIDNKAGDCVESLLSLNTLAKKLTEERIQNGAIAFEGQEVRFELDEKGKPIRVYQKVFQETNKLIEEFMLLANRRVAELIATKDKRAESVFVYRIHDTPNEEKMADLRDFLKTIGVTLPVRSDGKVTSQAINKMLKEVQGHAEEEMIQIATIRSMSKAVYSTSNIGHFGLGFEYYTHFTSPIRRYPDIMVHRLLASYLEGRPVAKKAMQEQEHVARYASQMEIAAAEAERASIKLKQIEYWSERVGDTWDGKISGVTEWGIYVEDSVTRSEGMVSLRDIPDDFYFFEEKNYRIVGKNKKKVFRLGDAIKVKVKTVDEKRKQISLALVK